MKTFLSLLALVAICNAACGAAKVGGPAPDFSVTDTNGKTETLAQYKGKYVVLEWTNPDCPIVHKHYDSGNMQKLQKEFTAKGVVWLSVDSSAPGQQGNYSAAELNKIMSGKSAAPTAILLDGDGKIGRAYDATNTPHLFIIDPKGNVIYQGAIDSIPSQDTADVPKATNYVKAALDEAMAGKAVTTPVTKAYGCAVKY